MSTGSQEPCRFEKVHIHFAMLPTRKTLIKSFSICNSDNDTVYFSIQAVV